ncbi:Trithorax group protein osa [Eumeta japonica]|uniref:Trithorax group protein osa n=1 Tax=Eumeta variegata TaxID=151549 RepID=A0A4C1SC44_EUMVA|nr:Trithorax group protein osa [Eumeta japonica]
MQDLTGQNSNDSGGSGGAGRASTPHLRPTPSPTGSTGSRSMSPAVDKRLVRQVEIVFKIGAIRATFARRTRGFPTLTHIERVRVRARRPECAVFCPFCGREPPSPARRLMYGRAGGRRATPRYIAPAEKLAASTQNTGRPDSTTRRRR